jgi:hypothetical protein
MGLSSPNGSAATPDGSTGGSAMNVDGGGPYIHWQQHLVPLGDDNYQPQIPTGHFEANVVDLAAKGVDNEYILEVAAMEEIIAPAIVDVNAHTKATRITSSAQSTAPMVQAPSLIQKIAPKLKSVIVGPGSSSDPLIPVIPSLIKQVYYSLPASPSPIF